MSENKPIPFNVEKGSDEERHLIKAANRRRFELNLSKNYGTISDEDYERLMAATYLADQQ